MDNSFEEIIRRALLATGRSSQAELAALLEIRPASVSEAKRRGNFPSDWIIKLVQKEGISPLWLLTGKGSRSLEIDPALLSKIVDGLEWKLSKDDLEMSPDNKAKWITYLYKQLCGEDPRVITREMIEEIIIETSNLSKEAKEKK